MSTTRMTMGTAAPVGPAAIGVFMFDRRFAPTILISSLLTTAAPAIAAGNRFEDTALRGRPPMVASEELTTIQRIRTLAAYEAGWDGPGSVGPTVVTVKQAIAFARQLHAIDGIAQPHISLASDGEINFYWKTPRLVLDLGFTGTGQYSYFGTTPEGAEFIEDDATVGDPLPSALITALHA